MRRTTQYRVLVTAAFLAAGIALSRIASAAFSAEGAVQTTPTAIQLQFPTSTDTPGPPTATATRTPTSPGPAVVEAISAQTNVRTGPDIYDTWIGYIFPGTLYTVIGKRFDWYEIEYPSSPNGVAWVYKDVVRLTGDPALIPELALEQIPTMNPTLLAAQQTALYITATPGAVASLTAEVMITPTGIFTAAPANQAPTLVPGAPLPTFTIPPFTNTPIVIPQAAAVNTTGQSGDGLPPILPILALGGLGLVGLLVAFLRRL